MQRIDLEAVRQKIEEITGGEVWEKVAEYQVDRSLGNEVQDVTITISYNNGAGFSIMAKDEFRGRQATGNPDHNLDLALATVHWQHLDHPGTKR